MEVLIRWKCHLPRVECVDCNGIGYHERWIGLTAIRFHSTLKYLICDRRFLPSGDRNNILHRAWASA